MPFVSTLRKPEATNNPCWICRGRGMRPVPHLGGYATCGRCRGTGVER